MDRPEMDSGNRDWIECLGMVSHYKLAGMRADDSLVALKILLGLSLLSYSALRQAGMKEREDEDAVNDFGRSAVGERKEEAVSRLSVEQTAVVWLTGRNTINEQANIYPKMRMICLLVVRQSLGHGPSPLLSSKSPQREERRRGKGRNGN
jgi:hypothetical protein